MTQKIDAFSLSLSSSFDLSHRSEKSLTMNHVLDNSFSFERIQNEFCSYARFSTVESYGASIVNQFVLSRWSIIGKNHRRSFHFSFNLLRNLSHPLLVEQLFNQFIQFNFNILLLVWLHSVEPIIGNWNV